MPDTVAKMPRADKPKLLDQRVKALLTRRGLPYSWCTTFAYAGQYAMIVLRWLLIKSTTTIATTLGSNFIRDVAPRSLEADLLRSLSGAVWRTRPRKISEERGRSAFSSSAA